MTRRYAVGKRCFDVVCTLFALPIVLPVMGCIALLIRLDSPGSPFFVQYRAGRGGTRFPMVKFRTMVHNAEALKASLAHLSVLPPPDFKLLDDPRVTRIGKILRSTSLDELPQLFNVLVGHMSLVGPRPTAISTSKLDLWQTRRLEVRPGLTGLWQIYGRNQSNFDDRLRYDLRYIDICCFPLDLRILAATVGSVIRRRGV